MTDFGAVPTQVPSRTVMDEGFDEATGQSTVAGALEDITGLTFDLTVPAGQTATIRAMMNCEVSAVGANVVGGWAVSINAVDKQEVKRNMPTATTSGSVSVMGRTTGLTAGSYTVKGRHRRVSGVSACNTDVAQLFAQVILE